MLNFAHGPRSLQELTRGGSGSVSTRRKSEDREAGNMKKSRKETSKTSPPLKVIVMRRIISSDQLFSGNKHYLTDLVSADSAASAQSEPGREDHSAAANRFTLWEGTDYCCTFYLHSRKHKINFGPFFLC